MIAQVVSLLQIVAPIFIIMGAGYGMRRARVLTPEADRSLGRLVVVLLAPCLAFDVIIGNEALTQPANLFIPPILGFGSVALGVVVMRIVARIFGIHNERTRKTLIFTTAIQNYGYIPLPLCAALFGRESLGVLFAFYLGVEIAFWTVALWQLTGHPKRGAWLQAVSPPIVAIPTAMVLNLLSAEKWIPPALDTVFHTLGVCVVPLGLILGGALIADEFRAGALRGGLRVTSAALLARVCVMPVLMLLFARYVPVDKDMKAVIIVQAAMPAAVFPIVLTKLHEGSVPVALQVVLGTSFVGLVTIPLWIGLGMAWIL